MVFRLNPIIQRRFQHLTFLLSARGRLTPHVVIIREFSHGHQPRPGNQRVQADEHRPTTVIRLGGDNYNHSILRGSVNS
jgi:hypothetical protein